VEHLLLCVALLTGIALVSLDLSSMQFPIAGFRKSSLVLGLLCRLGVCFQVITYMDIRRKGLQTRLWKCNTRGRGVGGGRKRARLLNVSSRGWREILDITVVIITL
jgi:hypothetical protein